MRPLKLFTFTIAAVLSVAFLSNCNKAEEPVAGFTYSADELTLLFHLQVRMRILMHGTSEMVAQALKKTLHTPTVRLGHIQLN